MPPSEAQGSIEKEKENEKENEKEKEKEKETENALREGGCNRLE